MPAPRRWIGLLLGSLFAWLSVVTGWSPCASTEMAGHGGAHSAVSEIQTVATVAIADGHAAHVHHAAPAQPADALAGLPLPHHAPSPAQGTTCPMAMACTPVGLAGDAIALLVTSTVPVDQHLRGASDRAPDSSRRAPEPPPPRA